MGKRGPKAQPTKIKKLKGNPGKRKLAKEPEIPGCDAKTSAPDFLDAVGKNEWSRIYKLLNTAGILKRTDLTVLDAYAHNYSRWREAEKRLSDGDWVRISDKGYEYKTAWLNISEKAQQLMLRYATELGLSPSSRGSLKFDLDDDAKNGQEKKDKDFFGD